VSGRRASIAAALLLGAALGLACRGRTGGDRVLVLGLDGLDPATVDLLISEGRLPNFARLQAQGAHGRLHSQVPLLSPVIWTTIATGKPPAEHRIGHFVAIDRATGKELPVTSRMRRVKAIWNIASEARRSVDVVGWWATWPAETVRGTIVSDHLCYHFLFKEGFEPASGPLGVVSPAERFDEVAQLVRRPSDISKEDLAPLVDVRAAELSRPFTFEDDLAHLRWALATAETNQRIGRHLWRHDEPDLLMLYIEAVDSASHLFGHLFRAGPLSGELEVQRKRYGAVVDGVYRLADRFVGEWMAALDDHTTLVVLSDHGFDLGALPVDPSKTRDLRRVSADNHRIDGCLFLYGRGIRPGTRIDGAGILDVAPTLLALLGVPPAEDMPGHVLTQALNVATPARVATYEHVPSVSPIAPPDPDVDAEMVARLRSLGYLAADSPEGDRNLAGILFESGRFEEALIAYRKLVEGAPNDAALRASLAGTLGALGRFDEALDEAGRAIALSPLLPEPYHNRAVIHERRGDRAAAIRDYRDALRYNPAYEPSREALLRLLPPSGGRPDVAPDPALERAQRLAEPDGPPRGLSRRHAASR
jgi:predicted AlkP superfamily pyrophosphatase or phosphodiesterase